MSTLVTRAKKAWTAMFPPRARDAYDPSSKPQASTGGIASEHSSYVVPVGQELHPDVDTIPDSPFQRRRCTLAYLNNTLVKGIVDSEVRQVCGTLHVHATTPSDAANAIINDEWKRLLHEGLHDQIDQTIRHILIDGGILIRPLGNSSAPLDYENVPYRRVRTPFGVIENADFPKFNEVRDGFKRDPKTGKITGYYVLHEESSYDTVYPTGTYDEEKMFAHPALARLAGQTKGLSWYSAAITKLEMISRWMNALLRSAEIHAYVVAMVRTPNKDARGLAAVNTTLDATNTKAVQAYANQHRFLFFPDNADFKLIQANAPIITDFLIANLRMVARSLGVSYERLTYDLTKTSFSSTKFGDRDDLITVKEHQRILERGALRQLHARLVNSLYLRPDMKMPAAGVYASNPELMLKVNFQFPGRPPVDEMKAENANQLAIKNRTACRTDIVATRGGNADEVLEKLNKEDAEFLKQRKQMWKDHGYTDEQARDRASDELAADRSKSGAITTANSQEDAADESSGKKTAPKKTTDNGKPQPGKKAA